MMNKGRHEIIEVREFDRITDSEAFRHQTVPGFRYVEPSVFSELAAFIRNFSGDGENGIDAANCLQIRYMKNVGDVISVGNYVGLIQLSSGCQIQILPKISFRTGEEDCTMRVFINMLRSLREFSGRTFTKARLHTDNTPLYEVFISLYLREVCAITSTGLRSGYIPVENNERFLKGKLLVPEQIKRNLAHADHFFVRYDDFTVNRPENRIIKSTLRLLSSVTRSSENSSLISRMLNVFDDVSLSDNYDRDFSLISIDRTTKQYETALNWSRVFLYNRCFSTFAGKTGARSLLFPIERLFQDYVAKEMRKHYSGNEWDISTQEKRYYLFDEPERRFLLQPDIIITAKDRHKVILDTKWKKISSDRSHNYGISQSDMYQMYAYSKKYHTPEIWLLYPINDEIRCSGCNEDIYFKSDDDVVVSVYFIDMADIGESLRKLEQKLFSIVRNKTVKQ